MRFKNNEIQPSPLPSHNHAYKELLDFISFTWFQGGGGGKSSFGHFWVLVAPLGLVVDEALLRVHKGSLLQDTISKPRRKEKIFISSCHDLPMSVIDTNLWGGGFVYYVVLGVHKVSLLQDTISKQRRRKTSL